MTLLKKIHKLRVLILTILYYHNKIYLNVVNSFHNTPLDLTEKNIEDKISSYNELIKIPCSKICMALRTVFNNRVFSFNNTFYKQVSGSPVGSPLSPIVSNIVMEHLENFASNCLDLKPDVVYKMMKPLS